MLSTGLPGFLDRKSTRLNSSYVEISYAVFCLKKKNNGQHVGAPTQALRPLLSSQLLVFLELEATHRISIILFFPGPLLRRVFFFFNDTATTEIYTLSLHDALPI